MVVCTIAVENRVVITRIWHRVKKITTNHYIAEHGITKASKEYKLHKSSVRQLKHLYLQIMKEGHHTQLKYVTAIGDVL